MTDRARGHRLERIDVWLPGPWFLRCRDCGADGERAADFRTPCPGGGTRPLAAADD